MMSELAIGWLLLDAAILAEKAVERFPKGHPDRSFYEGKHWSALWFARNVLPGVVHSAELIAGEDTSALEIPEPAFGVS
jgi:hypothetical protein